MEFNIEIAEDIKAAIWSAIEEGAEDIAEESKRLVPVESGALKDDCRIEETESNEVTVKYTLPYAAIQHEDLNAKHENGRAKFLEEPFNGRAEKIINSAAESIEKVIK